MMDLEKNILPGSTKKQPPSVRVPRQVIDHWHQHRDFTDDGMWTSNDHGLWGPYWDFRKEWLGLTTDIRREVMLSSRSDWRRFAQQTIDQFFTDLDRLRDVRSTGGVIRSFMKSIQQEIERILKKDPVPPKDVGALSAYCLLYRFIWIVLDEARTRGWLRVAKKLTFPKELDDRQVHKIVGVLPRSEDLVRGAFRSTNVKLVAAVRTRLDSLQMRGRPVEGGSSSLSERIADLEKFVADSQGLVMLVKQQEATEGRYRKQRSIQGRISSQDPSSVLRDVMRRAYDLGHFTRDMIPHLGNKPDLLTAALRVRKLPTMWKSDIRRYHPALWTAREVENPDGEIDRLDAFLHQDSEFVDILTKEDWSKWNTEEHKKVCARVIRAFHEGLFTQAAIQSLDRTLFFFILDVVDPTTSPTFHELMRERRRKDYVAWKRSRSGRIIQL